MMAGLVSTLFYYHVRLIISNLTTNEEINMTRYHYLKNAYLQYSNPFCQGSKMDNFIDGLFPTTKSYYSREDVLTEKNNNYYNENNNDNQEESYFENDKTKLLSQK